jgi:hypothetical protein
LPVLTKRLDEFRSDEARTANYRDFHNRPCVLKRNNS